MTTTRTLDAEEHPIRLLPESRRWPRWQAPLALLLFAATWIVFSWPLFGNLNDDLWGAVGDQTGFLSLYRELDQEGQFGFLPGTVSDFAAPEGLDYAWVNLLSQLPASLLTSVLFMVFSDLAAVSIFVSIAIVGSAWTAFLLARRVTQSPLAAIVVGVGFGFAPFFVIKSTGHADFSHGWVFVLMLWSWLLLIDRPSLNRALVASAAGLLAAAWTPYFTLLAGVLGAVLGVFMLVVGWRRKALLRSLALVAVAGALPVAWVVFTLLMAGSDPTAAVQPTRSLAELTVYAARPLEYLVPSPDTLFFGDSAARWRSAHLHGSNLSESLLYLGLTMLLFALIGTVDALRRRKHRALIGAMVVLALVAAWFSFPPLVAVGDFLIPTPSRALFEVQPGFRVYSRFVVLVLLATMVVAAFGVMTVLRWLPRNRWVQGAAALAFVAVVLADVRLVRDPNEVGLLPAYAALRDQPAGIAAEYPLVAAAADGSQAVFYQDAHGKRLINGYREGTEQEARALMLGDLGARRSIEGLRALGVRYLLVREDTELVGLPDPGTPPASLATPLFEGAPMSLYRIKPGPGTLAYWFPGTGALELDAKQRPFSWLQTPSTKLNIHDTCADCRATAIVRFGSFAAKPRTVRLTTDGYRREVKVAAGLQTVRVPLRFRGGTAEIGVSVTPGPTPVTDVDPASLDGRALSLSLAPPEVEVDRGK